MKQRLTRSGWRWSFRRRPAVTFTGWSKRNEDGLIRFFADTTPPDGLPGAELRNKNIAGVFTPGRQAGRYITSDAARSRQS